MEEVGKELMRSPWRVLERATGREALVKEVVGFCLGLNLNGHQLIRARQEREFHRRKSQEPGSGAGCRVGCLWKWDGFAWRFCTELGGIRKWTRRPAGSLWSPCYSLQIDFIPTAGPWGRSMYV